MLGALMTDMQVMIRRTKAGYGQDADLNQRVLASELVAPPGDEVMLWVDLHQGGIVASQSHPPSL